MEGNKITRNLNVNAGEVKTAGRTYGLDWHTYQAVGGYKPASQPRNPTPSDKSQEKASTRVTEVFKNVPNRPKTNVYRQTRYGS